MSERDRAIPEPALESGYRRLAGASWRFIVIVAAATLVTLALLELRLVVVPVLASLFVATVLVPPAEWLRRRGWPSVLATVTVVFGSLALLAGLISALAPLVANELDDLGQSLQEGVGRVRQWLVDGPLQLSQAQIDRFFTQAAEFVRSNAGSITTRIVRGARLAFEIVAGALLTLVIVFFFVKDGHRMSTWLLERVPAARRDVVGTAAKRSWDVLGAYIRGTAVIAFADALFIGIGLLVLGIPLVLPLSLLVFFGGFFPLIGATLAGVVAVLVALVSGGFVDALLVTAVIIGVQQLEGNVLEPVVLSKAVRLHPVVVLLSVTAGAVMLGIVGAFLAVPLVAVAAVVGNEVRIRAQAAERGGT